MARKGVEFVNHHVHSHFSTLDGLSTPQEIVQRVVDLGQRSISITDHGAMTGIPQMYQAARDADIGFTPGCEMYFATDSSLKSPDRLGEKYYHLILLAYNNKGYENLSKLQTTAWKDGYYYKPRIDYSSLEQYHDGLTITTSCLGGIVNQYLLRNDINGAKNELAKFVDIFGKDNVYVELQNHGIDEQLKILGMQRQLAKDFGLKMIATTDSHYCTHDECDVHDSLLCTGTKSKKSDSHRFKFSSDRHYLHSGEEMLQLFPHEEFPGAISNTVELAEKTEFTMNMGKGKKYLTPVIGTGNKTDDEVLREKVLQGASHPSRYGDSHGRIPDDVMERIDYELSVIKSMKFSSYFLIVHNIIDILSQKGIVVGPGRGCLHPDTPILTSDGWKKISSVSPGDNVVTEDGTRGTVSDVKKHLVGAEENLVTIVASQGESVTLTEKHKVLSRVDGEYRWVSAGDVAIGRHHLVSVDDKGNRTCHRVINVENAPADCSHVYDLSIDSQHHPSFMTNAGVVHNSAPGSVVVYSLGIVEVDPLEHGLLFERFLNPDRVSMPDIDIDIPKSRRKEALEIVESEYGVGHVAHLSNYNTMGMRDSLVRAAKVYGMNPSDANVFRDVIATWCEDYGESLDEFSRRAAPPADIASKIPDTPHYSSIVSTAARFVGRVMGNGVHASGILITNTPLDDNFPLRIAKGNPLPVCQYDGTDTESIGGVKFDLLGLSGIDECSNTERNILLDLGEKIDTSSITYDDTEVYELLSRGEGGGVFQLGCISGDTLVDGKPISLLYKLRNSSLATDTFRSLFLGKGRIDFHQKHTIVHSGIKDTVTISTRSGNKLTCTPEHHVWTHRGWVQAGDLIPHSDKVMVVPDNTISPYGVRGLDDIIDFFLECHPDWERYAGKSPVSVGGKTFYPHVISPDWSSYGHFYPDESYVSGVKKEEFSHRHLHEDGSRIIQVKSYSEVVEDYVKFRGVSHGLLSPVYCSMSTVESVSESGKKDTYDIMMHYPVNNFIAGGIVTHNSSGIQSLMRHMNPSEFKDIPALLALYRPGPMGMGTHDEYCERKNGRSPLDILHPDMEQVIKDNYNLIIYQEDIMHISRIMAGYTGGEADDLRKAMAKKNPEMMEKHHKKFVPAINEKYGNNLGQRLWDVIEPFGEYAFNSCLSGDTMVTTPDGENIRIDDVYRSFQYDDCELLSLFPSGEISPHRVKNIVHTGRKPVWKVITESGREIRVTREHRLLTCDGYESIDSGGIAVGTVVCTDGSRGEAVYKVDSSSHSFLPIPEASSHTPLKLHHPVTLSNGVAVYDMDVAKVGEYLISLGYGDDIIAYPDIIGENGEFQGVCSGFLVNETYIEVDSFNKGALFFADGKYAGNENFVCVTPWNYVDIINEEFLIPRSSYGDIIVEIVPPLMCDNGELECVDTYDIEMEICGPSNFIAEGIVSHNSHSVAYGYLTYRTAWLKAHYPAQFSGASVDQQIGKPKKVFEAVSWIKRAGVTIHPPDIQNSEMRSVTTQDSIYLPLHIIRGLGEKKAKDIIEEREKGGRFTSVADAISRCSLGRSLVINIAKAGGFDSFGVERAAVVDNVDSLMGIAQSYTSLAEMKTGLFGDIIDTSAQDDVVDLTTVPDFVNDGKDYIAVNGSTLSDWERYTLGVIVGKHPYEHLRESDVSRVQRFMRVYPPIDSFTRPAIGAKFSGFIYNIENKTSGRGNPYALFNVETDRGIVPGLRFSSHLDTSHEGSLVAFEGNIIDDAEYNKDEEDDDFIPKALCSTMRKISIDALFEKNQGE